MCYFPITWILFMVSNDIASVWWHLLWNPFLWKKTKETYRSGIQFKLEESCSFINLSFPLACTFHISSGDSRYDFELTMCSLIILQSTAFPPNPVPRPSSPTVENGTSMHPDAQALGPTLTFHDYFESATTSCHCTYFKAHTSSLPGIPHCCNLISGSQHFS